MKRYQRRVLGVAVGLTLGWLAQGYLSQLVSPVMAAPASSKTEVSVVTGAAGERAKTSQASKTSPAYQGHTLNSIDARSQADHSPVDARYAGAEQLLPTGQDMYGYGIFVLIVGGLFGAAVVIGAPAISFADRHRSNPADRHDTNHAPVVHVHKGGH